MKQISTPAFASDALQSAGNFVSSFRHFVSFEPISTRISTFCSSKSDLRRRGVVPKSTLMMLYVMKSTFGNFMVDICNSMDVF